MTADLILFEKKHIALGSLLGSGSFSSVYNVQLSSDKITEIEQRCEKNFRSQPKRRLRLCDSSLALRDSSQRSIESCHGEDNSFAVKIVKPSIGCPYEVEYAAMDLKKEAQLLCDLAFHPNIITFHGVSSGFLDCPTTGFVVLERLIIPLDKCLAKWRREAQSGMSKIFARSHLSRDLQAKRIQDVAIPVGNAMAHLHKHNIIFRDLKPANIGFGTAGIIRLFDFGLARKIDPNVMKGRLTGCCGTLRYMAPECAASEDYGFSADVHSFAMLLWEICTLEKPFSKFKTLEQVKMAVMDKDYHPPLKRVSFIGVQAILSESWQWEPQARPSFENLIPHLEAEVEDVIEERAYSKKRNSKG
mmetsp:Transcript_14290/g.18677  ORF Transcript_14290/g.18677 Transcript_14290/m.18677 type:complete len:359 (-) Transcript_14290:171-1247(-)